MEGLRVRMLGSFSIEVQGRGIDDRENRSQKPWLLLAYLLYHRSRVVTQEELLRLFWEEEEIRGDPANALRVVLHRTRTMLDRLGTLPGRELILRSRDGFEWNERLSVWIDAEEFEALYAAGKVAAGLEEKRACFGKAIDCYKGDFLGRNAGEKWVHGMAARFRAMYMEMALELLDILCDAGEILQAAQLCRRVLAVEPYCEEVCRRQMNILLELGQGREAAQFYEGLRERLMNEFGRLPEEETSKEYFRILQLLNPPVMPVDIRRPDADQENGAQGARVCDFSFYRMFYYSVEQLVVRCGLNVCNVLFTIESRPGKSLSERSRERLMDQLMEQLRLALRRGDAIARCADNQITCMVQADGYEETCMICERQVERFYRDHPNAPVSLHYGVWQVGKENT